MKTQLAFKIAIFIAVALLGLTARGQEMEKLKLTDEEIPAGYKPSSKMLCQSVQAASFYAQTDVYEALLGTVKNKSYQSFETKGDKGTILYLEYEEDFKGEAFLQGLLWGEKDKPTKAHPEEYLVIGKYLVIWSFSPDSKLKKFSKEKILQSLN
jgi:hypothetical protein